MVKSSLSGGALRNVSVGIVATIALAAVALAANPKDVKRAKNVDKFGECVRCDLSGADMRQGFYQLANMIEADLSGAKFDRSNMAGGQFINANLSNASFEYTNFSGAQFQGADLRGANFSNAWFNWAWFAGAKLDGANFADAKMIGAQLQGADFSKAVGLTENQLRFACGDGATKLPPGISAPRCPF